ncbi:MAG TPA: alpha-L-rhamnosidase C-terminal domain-containing protein [Opitutaceae bacterium]|nr:alpha-L-rhamnosidase C-terminal domain-containing protein [Opitutaceae bacterium]
MVAHGLTTWPERADPSRSDCHGWSAWMVYDFFAAVLGVTAGAPGWKHIRISPQISATEFAAGAFDCPTGRISVEWTKDVSGGTVGLQLTTPPGIPVTLRIAASPPLYLPAGANGFWTFPLSQTPETTHCHATTP